MSKPRFSWSRYGFGDPKNHLAYAGWLVGTIGRVAGGWRWCAVTPDESYSDLLPAWVARVPTVMGVVVYATPAEARAALEAFLRPRLRVVEVAS